MSFSEAEVFHDTRMTNSDIYPELYSIYSIKLEESVEDYKKWRCCTIRRVNTSPTEKYSVNHKNKIEYNLINGILIPAKQTI